MEHSHTHLFVLPYVAALPLPRQKWVVVTDLPYRPQKPKIFTLLPCIENVCQHLLCDIRAKSVLRSFYGTWKFIKALTHLRDPTASEPDGVCIVIPSNQEVDAKPHGLISATQFFMFTNFLGSLFYLASWNGDLFLIFQLDCFNSILHCLEEKLPVKFRLLCSHGPHTAFLGLIVELMHAFSHPSVCVCAYVCLSDWLSLSLFLSSLSLSLSLSPPLSVHPSLSSSLPTTVPGT